MLMSFVISLLWCHYHVASVMIGDEKWGLPMLTNFWHMLNFLFVTVVNWNQNTADGVIKTTEREKNEVQRQFSKLYLAKQCWACFHFNKHELSRQSNKLPSETTGACYFCSVKSLTRSSNNKSPKSKVCVMSHMYMQPFINNGKFFGIQAVYQKVENQHNMILREHHPIVYSNWKTSRVHQKETRNENFFLKCT